MNTFCICVIVGLAAFVLGKFSNIRKIEKDMNDIHESEYWDIDE